MDLSGQHIHFMGVGGIGVSALAELAMDAGAVVSGCDRAENELTKKLASRGVDIFIGHNPDHAALADLLVHTAAIPPDHPERVAAGLRQEKRGAFLARFMEDRRSIGVCGTHGKTTTSWLLSHLLIHAGEDPGVFIGGIVPDLPDGNFRLGGGPFVAELDESDASFLLPKLQVAIITNIDSDHLSHYGTDEALFDAFVGYAHGVLEDGLLVAGVDSPKAALLFNRHQGRKLSFGLGDAADVQAVDIEVSPAGIRFRLTHRGIDKGVFSLPMTGDHTVRNALAALGTCIELGLDADVLRTSIASVRTVGRRMEKLGVVGGAAVYSDYAHHPTEMAAAIQALRQRHSGAIMVFFQPHLYSRTRDYADEFGRALAEADAALVLDIYPAREQPLPGVDAGLMVAATKKARPDAVVFGPAGLDALKKNLDEFAPRYEAIVMMGAGDIDACARKLVPQE